jgi:predicted ATPase
MPKYRDIRLPAPYLRKVRLDEALVEDFTPYPFCLPLFRKGFELEFEKPITIIAGENGTGKSTLLEALAALAGFDQAGGAQGYTALDHSSSIEVSGAVLAKALKASWLPKLSKGWFFRAESFFSVARYLDSVGSPSADFLSHSHGEGFLRFFDERCDRQGLYIFDEPESALSPSRQIEFLKILGRMNLSNTSQVIMATHSPILMACPDAQFCGWINTGLNRWR